MLEINSRVKDRVELQSAPRFVPETEWHVDTSQIYEPPNPRLIMLGIGLAGFIVVLFLTVFILFHRREGQLESTLREIQETSRVVDSTANQSEGGGN